MRNETLTKFQQLLSILGIKGHTHAPQPRNIVTNFQQGLGGTGPRQMAVYAVTISLSSPSDEGGPRTLVLAIGPREVLDNNRALQSLVRGVGAGVPSVVSGRGRERRGDFIGIDDQEAETEPIPSLQGGVERGDTSMDDSELTSMDDRDVYRRRGPESRVGAGNGTEGPMRLRTTTSFRRRLTPQDDDDTSIFPGSRDGATGGTGTGLGRLGVADLIGLMLLSAGIVTSDALLEAVLRLSAEQARGPPPASKEFIDSLQEDSLGVSDCDMHGGEGEGPYLVCVVCQEHMYVGCACLCLPCTHRFHPDCLRPWLDLHNTCPVCRAGVPAREQQPPVDSVEPDGGISLAGSGRDPNFSAGELLHRLLGDLRDPPPHQRTDPPVTQSRRPPPTIQAPPSRDFPTRIRRNALTSSRLPSDPPLPATQVTPRPSEMQTYTPTASTTNETDPISAINGNRVTVALSPPPIPEIDNGGRQMRPRRPLWDEPPHSVPGAPGPPTYESARNPRSEFSEMWDLGAVGNLLNSRQEQEEYDNWSREARMTRRQSQSSVGNLRRWGTNSATSDSTGGVNSGRVGPGVDDSREESQSWSDAFQERLRRSRLRLRRPSAPSPLSANAPYMANGGRRGLASGALNGLSSSGFEGQEGADVPNNSLGTLVNSEPRNEDTLRRYPRRTSEPILGAARVPSQSYADDLEGGQNGWPISPEDREGTPARALGRGAIHLTALRRRNVSNNTTSTRAGQDGGETESLQNPAWPSANSERRISRDSRLSNDASQDRLGSARLGWRSSSRPSAPAASDSFIPPPLPPTPVPTSFFVQNPPTRTYTPMPAPPSTNPTAPPPPVEAAIASVDRPFSPPMLNTQNSGPTGDINSSTVLEIDTDRSIRAPMQRMRNRLFRRGSKSSEPESKTIRVGSDSSSVLSAKSTNSETGLRRPGVNTDQSSSSTSPSVSTASLLSTSASSAVIGNAVASRHNTTEERESSGRNAGGSGFFSRISHAWTATRQGAMRMFGGGSGDSFGTGANRKYPGDVETNRVVRNVTEADYEAITVEPQRVV